MSAPRDGSGGSPRAVEILRERLARGEIGEQEYRERLAVLHASSSRPPARPRSRSPSVPLVVAITVLVAAASLAVLAAWPTGGFVERIAGGPGCRVPALPGRTVDVTLSDMMGGMTATGAMMSVTLAPSVVPAGEVSLRVANAGSLVHELVVLPLPRGTGVGTRPVGADGRVSEAGSLGEASRTCGEGAGAGISPGAVGWVTLRLAPGRYELICNFPWHYAMGMHAELDVT